MRNHNHNYTFILCNFMNTVGPLVFIWCTIGPLVFVHMAHHWLISVLMVHHWPISVHTVHHWPKELLIWHCTVLSLGQMAQLIMIILSLTALTVWLKIWGTHKPLLSQFDQCFKTSKTVYFSGIYLQCTYTCVNNK